MSNCIQAVKHGTITQKRSLQSNENNRQDRLCNSLCHANPVRCRCNVHVQQALGETENEREVNTKLESVVRKFEKYLRKDPIVGGNCVDTSPENDKSIKFHYEGDYNLPNDVKHPTTYEEAIEFTKKFCSSSSKWMDKDPENENQSLGVPITVWLTPLVTMPGCHEAPGLRYEIPRWMASKCVLFMVDYDKVEDRLHGMLQDPLVKKLIPLEKKLHRFKENSNTFL